ncbi:hypothetical protein FRACYDRAFT_243709 [Fragilariopsis cylindrus CCMP1102]|uniref:F-box domain-containing protein n=1 Tax=Fragilariopsis cylindrus CCMP1102 TaxID=635003 RepID=A0A1E7F2U0_9STRA|nr:hypothetical protein FRACYDRAFT_243709 [Fragilariopsis cylindrus CCMP1102]|eukprot:OEU12457.1 hypothetical protein FRACYDRAFT_243709 [Fragilariopsis cylindrus CCMP1102]
MATHRISSCAFVNKTLERRRAARTSNCCVSLKKIFKHLQLALTKSATPKVAAKVAVVVVAVAPCEMEQIDIPPIDVSMLMALPTSLRIKILNYFDEKKQEELRTLPVISKQFYEDCQHPSIEWEFIPLIEISPTKGGSTVSLLYNLMKHQTDYSNTNINTQTTPYRSMKVNCMHRFDGSDRLGFSSVIVQMDRITSLNISWLPSCILSNSAKIHPRLHISTFPHHLPYHLSRMLPNLSEIFVSDSVQRLTTKTYFDNGKFISGFTENCHRLEKITWNYMNNIGENYGIHLASYNRLERIRRNNNNNNYSGRFIDVNGINMKDATNLRVLIMDNCTFFVGIHQYYISDLDGHPNDFLFSNCCKSLERVSIRNARDEKGKTIKQEALIKFVRSVPTLRWFRCDLHQENIDLLTKEHPDIEFC